MSKLDAVNVAIVAKQCEQRSPKFRAVYTGHVGEGGLQGHSVGALYPYVVYGQETPAGLRWGVMNGTKEADTGPIFRECKTAYIAADQCKKHEATIETLRSAFEVRKEWLRHIVPQQAMEVLV